MIKGGGHLHMPANYVDIQREVNSHHKDGTIEKLQEGEWVTDVAYCIRKWGENGGPGKGILDVGCRAGASLTWLEKEFPDTVIVGIDIVPEFVELALGRGVDARVADVHNLPFADDQFGWVVCRGTFEHFYDINLAAKEMARVASRLYVTCDLLDTPNDSDFAYSNSPKDWAEVFERCDMAIVDQLTYPRYVEFIMVRK